VAHPLLVNKAHSREAAGKEGERDTAHYSETGGRKVGSLLKHI
jgi:hypothetical protein